MAVARNAIPHLRLVFGGTTGSAAQEIWACTMKLIPCIVGTPPVPPSQAQAAASVAGLSRADLVTSVEGPMKAAVIYLFGYIGSESFNLDYVKLNAYGEDDLQVTDPTVETTFANVPGPVASDSPWSSALDFYHRSSLASRGFATHGRISFPTSLNVDPGSGKVTALGEAGSAGISLGAAATRYVTFLNQVRLASPGEAWYPGILYTSTSAAKPPKCSLIDQIIASDIPGEVRTRVNALTQGSARQPVDYPAPS